MKHWHKREHSHWHLNIIMIWENGNEYMKHYMSQTDIYLKHLNIIMNTLTLKHNNWCCVGDGHGHAFPLNSVWWNTICHIVNERLFYIQSPIPACIELVFFSHDN